MVSCEHELCLLSDDDYDDDDDDDDNDHDHDEDSDVSLHASSDDSYVADDSDDDITLQRSYITRRNAKILKGTVITKLYYQV